MSEKVTIAKRDLICDLCGRKIPMGTKFRLVKDDSLPYLTYFEHLICPSAPAAAIESNRPKSPVIHNNRPAMVLA